jgi:hypothetical protein
VFEISNQQLPISNWGKRESQSKELLKVNLFEKIFVHSGKSKRCTFILLGQILCKGVVERVFTVQEDMSLKAF